MVALDYESNISVGRAKFASAESIFELKASAEVEEGLIRVDLDHDRICIFMALGTYKLIEFLRGKKEGLPIVMNACYLPAVMEVLDQLSGGQGAYVGRRWFGPFRERCVFKGIQLDSSISKLEAAQALLENPLSSLGFLMEGNFDEA